MHMLSQFKTAKNGMLANLSENAWMVHAVEISMVISQRSSTPKKFEITSVS